MPFVYKPTEEKPKKEYRSIYLSVDRIKQIDQIAIENNTSFNKIVVSMIEQCLEEE